MSRSTLFADLARVIRIARHCDERLAFRAKRAGSTAAAPTGATSGRALSASQTGASGV
jgi:hypothetical protein